MVVWSNLSTVTIDCRNCIIYFHPQVGYQFINLDTNLCIINCSTKWNVLSNRKGTSFLKQQSPLNPPLKSFLDLFTTKLLSILISYLSFFLLTHQMLCLFVFCLFYIYHTMKNSPFKISGDVHVAKFNCHFPPQTSFYLPSFGTGLHSLLLETLFTQIPG